MCRLRTGENSIASFVIPVPKNGIRISDAIDYCGTMVTLTCMYQGSRLAETYRTWHDDEANVTMKSIATRQRSERQ